MDGSAARLARRRICALGVALICALSLASSGRADDVPPAPLPPHPVDVPPQPAAKPGPVSLDDLAHYDMKVRLDVARHTVAVRQKVRWTNPDEQPTSELVFQVVANNRPTKETLATADRTVESLRLDPRVAIDRDGGRFHLEAIQGAEKDLKWEFNPRQDTHLKVHLPEPVQPGRQVEIVLDYWIDLPQVMGRLGQYRGVTNLVNWYPVLTVFRDGEWKPVPYVPWHQPWYNEAGVYDVELTLPADHKFASGGHVVETSSSEEGWQTLHIHGDGLRDFTIVASDRYEVIQGQAGGVPVRMLYFPGHEQHAELSVKTAEESIRTYSEWFGPYAYQEFELVESYFGWNGNESSGLVMIDDRILDAPQYAARYIEHLVSHETCHQWWYSAVGTNGYAEPFMDESLVSWLTRVKIEDKYGENASVLDLPGYGPIQFPNVSYRNLVNSGYDLYRSRGGAHASVSSLDEIGHLHNLFFLVYDRGARIVGMLQHRMGRERFLAFLRVVYERYRFRQLSVADFHKELEEFTQQDWNEFFEKWLYGTGTTDWEIDDVQVTETSTGFQTQAHVHQKGDVNEPVELEFLSSGQPVRIVPLADTEHINDPDVHIEQVAPDDWLVTIASTERPTQVIVDPDGNVLDEHPENNAWHPGLEMRVSPLYSPADETSLAQPWRQNGLVGGFGIDSDGRFGLRGALIASNRFRVSPFIAYTAATATRNDDHFSAGIDAVLYNAPAPNWQLLARYEYALFSTLENNPGHQARFAARKVLTYTTSLTYPNLSYIDIYARFGDNFFPDQDKRPVIDPAIAHYDNVRAFGIDYHADSQMPYWDPDSGVRFDGNYEHGYAAFGGGQAYDRVSGQFGTVRRLDFAPGWLSETKLAGRVAGGYGWNDNGEHFRFGGPGRFRGRTAASTRSNAFWLTSAEWRFPIKGDIDYEVLDNTAALDSISGAIFYDVGESYLFNKAQGPVDHAVGGGLYFGIPLLSFVENITFRAEYGYSLINSTSAAWFGLYRAF